MPFLGKTPSQIVDPEVDIDGGAIDGVSIGSVTASAGAFTNLTATGTLTLPDDGISGDDVNGGTISNFASTGIDDNATSTQISLTNAVTSVDNILKPASIKFNGSTGITWEETVSDVLYTRYGLSYGGNRLSFTYDGSTIARFLSSGEFEVYNDLTVDTDTLVVDSTNNRVGIGTASPTSSNSLAPVLEVKSAGASTPTGFRASNSSASSAFDFFVDGSKATIDVRGGQPFTIETSNNERFRVSSDGNVSIGQTFFASPTMLGVGAPNEAGFEVQPEQSTNTCRILGYDRVGSAYTSFQYDALDHTFTVSSSQALTVISSGNVGIGETDPATRLEVAANGGSNTFSPAIKVTEQGVDAYGGEIGARFVASNNKQGMYVEGYNSLTLKADTTAIDFIVGAGSAAVDTDLKMRLGSGGLTMYGTNITSSQNGFNPTTSSWATGAAYVATSSYGGALSLVDGPAGYSVFVDTAGTKFRIAQGSTSGGLSTKVSIDSAGRVGIGEANPTHLLEVAGSFAVDAPFAGTIAHFVSDSQNTGQGAQIRQYNSYSSGSNGQKFLRVTESGEWQVINNAYSAAIISITDAGAAYQGNNSSSWSTVSDIRIKDNVRDISDALGKMKALKPCHFEYKKELGKTRTGFIAQEFEQVFEGHVEEQPVPMGYEEFLGDGETTIKTIDANLIPYLVKAIQEQQAIIEDLQTRLSALEAN